MTGQDWNREDVPGLSLRNTRSLEEILVDNSACTNTHHLKMRLLAPGLKEHICEKCGLKA